jgi:hypothetical protein
MVMKRRPVDRLSQSSTTESLLKKTPANREALESTAATKRTGMAVPTPYRKGRSNFDSYFNDRGMTLPKKRAADVGQKESAKINPRTQAPEIPLDPKHF